MCGRFTLIANLDEIANLFNAVYADNLTFEQRYNIAPSQSVLSIVNDGKKNRLGKLRWGLIPFWAKDPKIGYKMINARAETLHEKPAFKSSFQRRRCLILADSFYEWRRNDGGKVPMRIQLKSKDIFAFAGIWDRWEQHGEQLHSCSIITTKANSMMADIHHRMPVILDKADQEKWLNPFEQDLAVLNQLLTAYPSDDMEAYEVSTLVNSAKNETPEVIEPV